jgi:putative ABC transport system ATP-binding protein
MRARITAPPTASVVRIRDLRFRYPGTERDVLHVEAFDLDAPELVAITGSSGAGKTTLMELLAGTLREAYAGSLQVLGVELRDQRRDADRQRHLRRVGLVPQDYALLPGSTVREILIQDLTDAQVPVQEHERRIGQALQRVGLASFADRNSEHLSGGQRQRIAIARTLARDVELLIADEPTANLDPATADSVLALFRELGTGRPVVIVTHDPSVAARCDRNVVLRPPAETAAGASSAWLQVPGASWRRRLQAAAGMAALLLAAVGSTLAVRATNDHHNAKPKAGAVALRPAGGVLPGGLPTRGFPAVPSRGGALPVPGGALPGGGLPGAGPVASGPVKVVQVTHPVPVPVTPTPQPPSGQGPTGGTPAPTPVPSPTSSPQYFLINGVRYAVCTTSSCGGTFLKDDGWSASSGAPAYDDDDGSIIGNRHGLPVGEEVDFWNGTSLLRYEVMSSTTTEGNGRPPSGSAPRGAAMELGGVDQENVCLDSGCAGPYYYTVVDLAALS